MGVKSVATMVPSNTGELEARVKPNLMNDIPSKAPRKTADHKPTNIHVKSALETLFNGGGSAVDVTVSVELQESSFEYVLWLELAMSGVRSSTRARSDANPIFVTSETYPASYSRNGLWMKCKPALGRSVLI